MNAIVKTPARLLWTDLQRCKEQIELFPKDSHPWEKLRNRIRSVRRTLRAHHDSHVACKNLITMCAHNKYAYVLVTPSETDVDCTALELYRIPAAGSALLALSTKLVWTRYSARWDILTYKEAVQYMKNYTPREWRFGFKRD